VQLSIPPIAFEDLREFNLDAVKNPDNVKQKRTTNKYFFNTVSYRFEEDPLEGDKFNAGEVIYSQRSVNRIPSQTKALTISSKGLRDSDATRNFIRIQTRRFSDRYNFAAPVVQIGTKYKDGYRTEIGDVVLFGSPDMQLPNDETGDRNTEPILYEVIDKSMNLKNGNIEFSLLSSGFGLDGRYGIVSPNSFIAPGSTTSRILLKNSFATGEFEFEREKWTNLVGEEIEIHNDDYSFRETVVLREFDSSSLNGLLIDPPLSVAPPEDYIVDLPQYPLDEDRTKNRKMKNIFVFYNPRFDVVSGISTTQFELAPADIALFREGAVVRVFNEDYSIDSRTDVVDDDAVVTNVDTVGNILTVDRSLGFVPTAGLFVDLVGYIDGGLPYRIL
jgi:hypothetical protein